MLQVSVGKYSGNGQYSEWFVFRVVIGYSKASASL